MSLCDNTLHPLPASVKDLPEYARGFEDAVRFTRSLGIQVDYDHFLPENISKKIDAFSAAINSAGVTDLQQSAGKCLPWCYYLAPYFEKHLHKRVWLTVGQVWLKDTPIYSPSWSELRRWKMQSLHKDDILGRSGLGIHAWLTVETGEIIDPTFLSTLASIGIYSELSGQLLVGRDPDVIAGHRYFPMAVGNEFAEAMETNSIAPLLAGGPDELNSTVGCFFP